MGGEPNIYYIYIGQAIASAIRLVMTDSWDQPQGAQNDSITRVTHTIIIFL